MAPRPVALVGKDDVQERPFDPVATARPGYVFRIHLLQHNHEKTPHPTPDRWPSPADRAGPGLHRVAGERSRDAAGQK